MKKVKAVQDDSGHWYVIPVELYEEFCTLIEDEEEVDEFDFIFGKYMTGGGLNLIQLYAEL